MYTCSSHTCVRWEASQGIVVWSAVSAMTNPVIASKYRKMELLPHCPTCTKRHFCNARPFSLYKQVPQSFCYQMHTRSDDSSIHIRLKRLQFLLLHFFTPSWNTDIECESIRTSKEIGVDTVWNRGSVRWPWFFRTSCTYALPFTLVTGTDLLWKRVWKISSTWPSFLAYRWIANEALVPWPIHYMPSSCSKLSGLDGNMHYFNLSCSIRLSTISAKRARRMWRLAVPVSIREQLTYTSGHRQKSSQALCFETFGKSRRKMLHSHEWGCRSPSRHLF